MTAYKMIGAAFVIVLFMGLAQVAIGQEAKPTPVNQDAEDATESMAPPEVTDFEPADELDTPPAILAAEAAAEKARDDAPFVPTLDHPLPPPDPDEYVAPLYVTAAYLQPHETPLHIIPFKPVKTSGWHIAVFKRPFEVAGKATTDVAANAKRWETGVCGKPANATDHWIKPCVTPEPK